MLAAEFNREQAGFVHAIVDPFTDVFMGDGCLMEGISHEVCSPAGMLHLSKIHPETTPTQISVQVRNDN